MFLEVQTSQNDLFVFADTFVLSFDINNFKIVEFKNMSTLIPYAIVHPHAVDLTDLYAILVGFMVFSELTRVSVHVVVLVKLYPLDMATILYIDVSIFHTTAQVLPYNRANDMSVVVNPSRQMAIIGLPLLNKVVLLSINTTSSFYNEWMLNITRTDVAPQHCTGFGRSIALVDDTTVAIAILTVPNRP